MKHMGRISGIMVDLLVIELRYLLIFLYFLSEIGRKVIIGCKNSEKYYRIQKTGAGVK